MTRWKAGETKAPACSQGFRAGVVRRMDGGLRRVPRIGSTERPVRGSSEASSAVWNEHPNLRVGPRMPIEFLHGRPLGPEELELIRRQVEEGFEVIAAVDDEIRGIVARNWPHLLAKLPPEEDG
jgi:hypothetical protein